MTTHLIFLTGLISESFAHEIPAPDFALAVFKGLSHVAPPRAHPASQERHLLSRSRGCAGDGRRPADRPRNAAHEDARADVRADERLKNEFPSITLPVLILHDTADQATKPSGSQRFYDMTGSQDKTLKLYEGHFHDLLNDLDKEIVIADIKNRIVDHLRF